jgi:hypothetical protein
VREGRETITKPVPILRHLIPERVNESSVIEHEISDRYSDRYDKDEPADRHNATLKKSHTNWRPNLEPSAVYCFGKTLLFSSFSSRCGAACLNI